MFTDIQLRKSATVLTNDDLHRGPTHVVSVRQTHGHIHGLDGRLQHRVHLLAVEGQAGLIDPPPRGRHPRHHRDAHAVGRVHPQVKGQLPRVGIKPRPHVDSGDL